MIATIDVETIWHGRQSGVTWFHPRACQFPTDEGPAHLMACQPIGGSDVFGQVHWSLSTDHGRTWSTPEPIHALGRRDLPDGNQEGICDVVPGHHAATGVTLAVGHNVYYRDNILTKPSEDRFPVYAVRGADSVWRGRHRLAWPTGEVPAIYTSGCAQRVDLADGHILLPISAGDSPDAARWVATALCAFDGCELAIEAMSNRLHLEVRRGLLEPSLAVLDNRVYMTIRAEDDRGYVTTSYDGMTWSEIRPWCWDDGEPLTMSTTQQRWIANRHGLFLVYTRKAAENANVMRWRAPLFIAQVDTATLRLIRATERVAIPMVGDSISDPDHVARMGNFHTVSAGRDEAWITVGETLPADGWRGDTLLARVRWA